MTIVLGLMNLKIGATGAITTGTLIPSIAKISTNFGLLGTLTTGPIGIAAVAIGGLYLAWKTNLFGMRDITREAIADIKGNFTNLSDFLKSGGGGGAGAFFDEKPTLPEINPDTSNDDFQKQMEEDAKAAEDMAAAIGEATEKVADYILEMNDPLGYQIELLDREADALREVGVEESLVTEWYEKAKNKLIEESEATKTAISLKEKLADMTKTLADRMFELTHTGIEIAIKKLDEQKQAYLDFGLAKKDIIEWYDLEIQKIKELNKEMTKTPVIIDKVIKGYRRMTMGGGGQIGDEMGGGGQIGDEMGGQYIPVYQNGTPSVPKTGLALIHKGEEINPPGKRSYDQSKNFSPTVYVTVQGDGDANKIKSIVEQTLNDMARQYSRTGYEMAY